MNHHQLSNTSIRPKIHGAWVGLLHWSQKEGRRWNTDLSKFTSQNWREVVRGMVELQMEYLIIQESFRNQQYYGHHQIPTHGYHGKAFFPSYIVPDRMPINDLDPIETILSEADLHGIRVFVGMGLYAWFDFTPHSVQWHKKVADELWQRYGHHRSFYGWYISEEVNGSLMPGISKWQLPELKKRKTTQYRAEIISFFKELRAHCNRYSAEKPLMLAPNCHFMRQAEATWREILKYCNILCPFGFNRMPKGDISSSEVADWLNQLCSETGARLWLDMEIFHFGKYGELFPRPIHEIIAELQTFSQFEKVICYQYPGLLNAPWAQSHPGGLATVELYQKYLDYLIKLE